MTFKEHLSTIIRTRQSMAQRVPKARDLSRFGYLPPSNLHGDTLPSVTNHSEREHSVAVMSRCRR